MTKGLDELLYGGIDIRIKEYGNCIAYTEDCVDIILKELKALEIIKKKWIDVGCLIVDIFHENKTKESYNSGVYEQFQLTQEEFDLLKEVLCND